MITFRSSDIIFETSLPASEGRDTADKAGADGSQGDDAGNAAARTAAAKLADQIREQVLGMEDGEFLGSQEDLLTRYQVNVPTLRQAMVALMNEQLVTSRRGVKGGFFVRRPNAEVVTNIVALYLRSRGVVLAEQVATLLPVRIEIARRAAHSRDSAPREELIAFLEAEKGSSVDVSFREFNAAERQFNRLLARMSGSTILTLFLEILLGLSHMIYREGDVFGGNRARRLEYRKTRNLIAKAVLAHDEIAAAKHAQQCFRLTSTWLRQSRPDLAASGAYADAGLARNTMFAETMPGAADGDSVEREEIGMASEGTNAVEALRKIEEQQRNLEERRNLLEQAAAAELGRAVIKGGGLVIESARLTALVERIVALGVDESARRLDDGERERPE